MIEEIDTDDIFAVYTSKTLQNSKYLMSTPIKGAYYYEFTYNKYRGEIYMVIIKRSKIHLDESEKRIVECVK
ncbi:DUF6275 family protein [Anaerococcus senegalensis]|uniref:DUF6275 family protein n=1 Tax=Anaerococcus senegalensis TaxID=1288120 RepID=UPI0002ED0F35|nr:DUF6275 family protein [Anaerococcus senegalensis]